MQAWGSTVKKRRCGEADDGKEKQLSIVEMRLECHSHEGRLPHDQAGRQNVAMLRAPHSQSGQRGTAQVLSDWEVHSVARQTIEQWAIKREH